MTQPNDGGPAFPGQNTGNDYNHGIPNAPLQARTAKE